MHATDEARRRMTYALIVPGVLLGCWATFGLVERFWPKAPRADVSSPVIRNGVNRARMARALTNSLHALGRHADWKAILKVADQALSAEDNGPVRMMRAEARLRLGMRSEAAEDWKAQLEPSSSGAGLLVDGANPVAAADLLALRGDAAAYAAHVRKLVDSRDPANATALDANNAAWAAVLLPSALTDYTKVVALGQRGVAVARNPREKALYLNTLGVALFRAGRIDDARKALQESESVQTEPFNWPFLAMIDARGGRRTEADAWAARLRTHLQTTFGDTGQVNRHELILFDMEMAAALGRRPRVPAP